MGPVAGAFAGYVVVFAGTLGASLLAAFILFALRPDEPPGSVVESLPGLLAGGFASSTTLLAVALIGTRPPRARRLRVVAGRASSAAVLVMVIATLALGQALDALAFVLGLQSGGVLEAIRRALTGASGGMIALAVVGIGVFAGCAEELFFRGFMQARLRERWPAWWAIAVTALCFGLLHVDRVHAALAFFLGLYLGFITELSGSIVPAVVCHVANNVASILMTAFFATVTDFWPNLALLLIMTAVFAASMVAIRLIVPAPRARAWRP